MAAVAASFVPLMGLSAQSGGTPPVAVLELPASTRALALGNSFVAAGTDEAAIFYNPAQLAVIPHTSAGLSVQQWFLSSTVGALAAATRLAGGTVAVGLQVIDWGSSERAFGDPSTQADDGTGATVSAGDYAASVAYAHALGGLRLGATAKYVNQRLVNESGGTAAVDVGAAFDLLGVTFAAALQNMGGSISLAGNQTPLPRTVHVGAAVPVHNVGPVDLLATVEVAHVRGGDTQPAGGLEVSYQATSTISFVGRVGGLARPVGAAISPVSFGGGLRAHHLAIDYAYEGSAVLGATHRIGVRWWK
jgi:hypothetical protein